MKINSQLINIYVIYLIHFRDRLYGTQIQQ